MSDALLIERLAALPSLASVPRDELAWLAAHGDLQEFEAGAVLFTRASPPTGTYVVLSGCVSVRVVRDGMARTVYEQRTGDVGGRLPYSRMPTSFADAPRAMADMVSMADEPVEILLIAESKVRDMARECHDLTAMCVHQMVDRARLFKLDDLQREKMASLGRLAAGLAHELNNPAAAAARGARLMRAYRQEVADATRTLCAMGLTRDQLACIEALEFNVAEPRAARTPLEAVEREDEVLHWLERHGLDPVLAEPLTSATAADLEAMASALPPGSLSAALRYVAASAMVAGLAAEIEHATRRIELLVSAVTRHTHMDRVPFVDAIDVRSTLADTLTLAESKAHTKTISLALHADSDLPPVPGVAGQLNDVWMNLIDNAIDSAPAGGHITVSARRAESAVVVCVTDDGPGIPREDQTRVFEPFFTTKPVGQGAGLGLDVVQRVVRSHGGVVELSSQPGHTEFRVTLPAAPAPQS